MKLTKLLDFSTVVKRLEKAFPECDIGLVQRITIGDAKQRIEHKYGPAWQMVIAEKPEKQGD